MDDQKTPELAYEVYPDDDPTTVMITISGQEGAFIAALSDDHMQVDEPALAEGEGKTPDEAVAALIQKVTFGIPVPRS